MRNLVLLALLTGTSLACREATAPADATAFSEASDRAHIDLRKERTSLIAAANAVSDAMTQQGLVAALGVALTDDALFLSPRTPVLEGRTAALSFLSTNPIAPSAISWQAIVADVSNDGTQGFTGARAPSPSTSAEAPPSCRRSSSSTGAGWQITGKSRLSRSTREAPRRSRFLKRSARRRTSIAETFRRLRCRSSELNCSRWTQTSRQPR